MNKELSTITLADQDAKCSSSRRERFKGKNSKNTDYNQN